jgi:hypothetical protein
MESSVPALHRVDTVEALLAAHIDEIYENSIHTTSSMSEEPGNDDPPCFMTEMIVNHSSNPEQAINNGSSNYPSALPSFDPSPSGSDSHGYVLSQKDLDNLELSPVHCMLNFKYSQRND